MRGEFSYTLLHDAVWDNSTSCIRVLLRFAPHLLDAVNGLFNNETALMRAVENENRDAAKMLLRAGADVRAKNINDETVFDIARSMGNEEMLDILKQRQQVSGIF